MCICVFIYCQANLAWILLLVSQSVDVSIVLSNLHQMATARRWHDSYSVSHQCPLIQPSVVNWVKVGVTDNICTDLHSCCICFSLKYLDHFIDAVYSIQLPTYKFVSSRPTTTWLLSWELWRLICAYLFEPPSQVNLSLEIICACQ